MIGSDLGSIKKKIILRTFFCFGEADAVFKTRLFGRYVIGEYKHRVYKGKIRYREYYQTMLYMGAAQSTFKTKNVIGYLRFRNETVRIKFEPIVYEALQRKAKELNKFNKNNLYTKPQPLHVELGSSFPITRFKLINS